MGSSIGSYKWSVNATGFVGTGTGFVTVNITAPEPASLSLVGFAPLAGVGFLRRRK